jgi:hypothetical protein
VGASSFIMFCFRIRKGGIKGGRGGGEEKLEFGIRESEIASARQKGRESRGEREREACLG